MTQLYSLVFARQAHAELLIAALDGPHQAVANRAAFIAAIGKRRPAVAYVDVNLLSEIDGETSTVPIVAIVDGALDGIVRSLVAFPWLSNTISVALLSGPQAKTNVAMVRHRIDHHHVLSAECQGRGVLIAASSRREQRLDRVREYFAAQNAAEKMIATVTDVVEELITNALYDAPVEAGYFMTPVERTADVELPPEYACEISYGIDNDNAFVRCRDPFGALTRKRLLSVLDRCNRKGVSLDESRGGAGLGLWRIFSCASSVAVIVIPGRLTDILVWFELKKQPRAASRILHAVHMFFPDADADGARGRFAADHDHDLMDDSFTALLS